MNKQKTNIADAIALMREAEACGVMFSIDNNNLIIKCIDTTDIVAWNSRLMPYVEVFECKRLFSEYERSKAKNGDK